MAISPLPTPPSTSNPATFAAQGDALLGALPMFVTEANALEVNVNAKEASASSSASTATTQAGLAITAKDTAVAAKDTAVASASAAGASMASALGYLNTMLATSYGAYASDPALDPLGNAPTVGDEYFNTTVNLMKHFNGSIWVASDINTGDLAASTGSSLVGHIASGVGAVARTAQAKLREFVSVEDFGAIGDGVTDDTVNIQKAIDTGKNVYFKSNSYVISASLQVGSQQLIGQGITATYGQSEILPSGNFPAFINKNVQYTSFSIDGFYINYGSSAPTVALGNSAKYGFYITGANYPEFYAISNCTVKGGWGAFYDNGGSYQSPITSVFSHQNRYGFTKLYGTTIKFDTCFHIGGVSGFIITDTLSPILINCACDGTTPVVADAASNLFTNIKSLVINGFDCESNVITGDGVSFLKIVNSTAQINGLVGYLNKLVCAAAEDVYFLYADNSLVNINTIQAARSVGDLAFNGTAGSCYTLGAINNSKVLVLASSLLKPTNGTGTPTNSYSAIGGSGSTIKTLQSSLDVISPYVSNSEELSGYTTTFTPTLTSFTVTGVPIITGAYSKNGNIVSGVIEIDPNGGTVACVAATSNINLSSLVPYPVAHKTLCSASNATVSSYGSGILTTANLLYPPAWTASSTSIIINFSYITP